MVQIIHKIKHVFRFEAKIVDSFQLGLPYLTFFRFNMHIFAYFCKLHVG